MAFQFVGEAAKAKKVWPPVLELLSSVAGENPSVCMFPHAFRCNIAVAGQNLGHLFGNT